MFSFLKMKSILKNLLRFFAKRIIKKYNPQVIGITGSIGKTGAKDAVAAVLAGKFRVRKSQGNYNTEIGMPLSILGKKSPHRSIFGWLGVVWQAFSLLLWRHSNYPEILVLEMGADKSKDIYELLKIVTPDVGIITAVALVHTQNFGSIEAVAKEKGRLFKSIEKDGWIIVNNDDEMVASLAENCKAQKISYAINNTQNSDIKALEYNISYSNEEPTGLAGISFKMAANGAVSPVILKGILGKHQIYSSLAAMAVARIYNINIVEAAENLRLIKHPPGRMRILEGIKHTVLIDDSYNSSPRALEAALATLSDMQADGRKFAVLGDMLELGSISEAEHRRLGKMVFDLGFDVLITSGELARDFVRGAQEAGMSQDNVFSFSNSQEARLFVQSRIKEGDLVLIKGSQGSRMEIIVKEIMAHPQMAEELLVRQGQEWASTNHLTK